MAALGGCNVGPWSAMGVRVQNTYSWEQLWRTGSVYWGTEGDIYAPGKVARVSGARFVWLCTIDQDRGVGRYFICILKGLGEEPYKVKQGVKHKNCQG